MYLKNDADITRQVPYLYCAANTIKSQFHISSELPQSGTALFRAISPHQPPSGKTHSSSRTNDLAKITHPFG